MHVFNYSSTKQGCGIGQPSLNASNPRSSRRRQRREGANESRRCEDFRASIRDPFWLCAALRNRSRGIFLQVCIFNVPSSTDDEYDRVRERLARLGRSALSASTTTAWTCLPWIKVEVVVGFL